MKTTKSTNSEFGSYLKVIANCKSNKDFNKLYFIRKWNSYSCSKM